MAKIYHRSFAHRFIRLGFTTLFVLPQRLTSVESAQSPIPARTIQWRRLSSFGNQFPHIVTNPISNYSDAIDLTDREWDDPRPRRRIEVSDLRRVSDQISVFNDTGESPATGISPNSNNPTTNVSSASPKFINLNTRKGRQAFSRFKKNSRATRSLSYSFCQDVGTFQNHQSHAMAAVVAESATKINDTLNLTGGSLQSDTDTFEVIWDTGASMSISHTTQDFVGEIDWFQTPKTAVGIASGLKILGKGKINWLLKLNNGRSHMIEIEAYYCPTSQRRLLSPQQLQQHLRHTDSSNKLSIEITADSLIVRQRKGVFYVEYSPSNNLPISFATARDSSMIELSVAEVNACLTAAACQNINNAQKELLRSHFKLGHLSMQRIQSVLRTGVLTVNKSDRALHLAASKCEIPKCAACEFAKARKKPLPGQRIKMEDSKFDGNTSKGILLPGQCIAVDHFVSSAKGRLFSSAGRTSSSSMYSGACVFTDLATKYIHVEPQVGFTSHETLEATARFESHMRDLGVTVQQYRFDNGSAFTSAEFQSKLANDNQSSTRAGPGAHSQNGTAERTVLTLSSIARTMMIHAAIHWPNISDTSLWPMAVRQAAYIHNRFPMMDNGLAPYELLTQSKWERRRLLDLHVWGAPVYVLDPQIQDGKKLPRWKPRSRRGQYVGYSPEHASTVPLILNLTTHRITAQFHVVFDDWFTTVDLDPDDIPDFDSQQWTHLFGENRYQYEFDPDDGGPPPLDNEYRDDTITQVPNDVQPPAQREESEGGSANPVELPAPVDPTPDDPLDVLDNPIPDPITPDEVAPDDFPENDEFPIELLKQREHAPKAPAPAPPTRCSLRSNKGTFSSTRYHDEFALLWASQDTSVLAMGFIVHCLSAASASYPDTLSYEQAMRATDSDAFRESALQELRDLVAANTWTVVDKTKALTKILPGIWVFRRKRNQGTGEIKKHKGRYTVRGDLQEGKFDTFAPVVQWSTVRMLMAIALRKNYKTRCIDFSSAFVQASLKTPVWIHLPRGHYPEIFGHDTEGKCLELNKSLYGLSVAPKLWYLHLRERLVARGFRPSTIDPCLYYRNEVAIAIYVDDVVMISKTDKQLDNILTELQMEFKVTDEGPLSGFLGVDVKRSGSQFLLTQPTLINKVITATGLQDCNPNHTPATVVLGSHKDEPKHDEAWDYASVVGMLMYLSCNSRPDIAFALHQCARFTHDPRRAHSQAIKQIVRYLRGTADKGIIFSTKDEATVDCYVDADFAGAFNKDGDTQDPATARSRTGYIIFAYGVPICWGSKLQTEIALSTTEAEYIALSTATREVLGLRNLLEELSSELDISKKFVFTTMSQIFEDNNGAIALAKSPTLTPRTKHFATKLHFFKSHIKENGGVLEIKKIDTKDQAADIFTKPLDRTLFTTVRTMVMGW
jgi:Reverse transcriptase (RNA-dependent DNA polymerase)